MDEQHKNYLPEKLEKDFDEFYRARLLQDFMFLEPLRKKYLRQFVLFFVIFVFGALVARVLAERVAIYERAGEATGLSNLVAILIVGLLFFAGIFLKKPAQNYKKDTKKMVMPKIMDFFKNITYQGDKGGISGSVLRKSDLFEGMANVYCDDTFRGSIQGTEFQLGEQRITTYVQTKNGQREVTMFQGIFLLFQLGKKFNGQTVVKDKKGQMWVYFLSFLSVALLVLLVAMNVEDFMSGGEIQWDFVVWTIVFIGTLLYGFFKSKYKKVNLEDVVFAKNWRVKATDQVEARYILTPALMERMLKIKKMFYGKSLHFAFFDNQVLIAVGTSKDMFETTSLFSSALNYQKVREVIAQFYSVFAIIEEMKQSGLGEKKLKRLKEKIFLLI